MSCITCGPMEKSNYLGRDNKMDYLDIELSVVDKNKVDAVALDRLIENEMGEE